MVFRLMPCHSKLTLTSSLRPGKLGFYLISWAPVLAPCPTFLSSLSHEHHALWLYIHWLTMTCQTTLIDMIVSKLRHCVPFPETIYIYIICLATSPHIVPVLNCSKPSSEACRGQQTMRVCLRFNGNDSYRLQYGTLACWNWTCFRFICNHVSDSPTK